MGEGGRIARNTGGSQGRFLIGIGAEIYLASQPPNTSFG